MISPSFRHFVHPLLALSLILICPFGTASAEEREEAAAPPQVAEQAAQEEVEEASAASSSIKESLRERLFSEMNFQSEYSRLNRHNDVNDLWLKQGVHLFKLFDRDVDVYVKERGFYDRNNDFWNNRYEYGLGTRWRPFEPLGLVLFAEVLRGRYTGREGADANTYANGYDDFQSGAYFWQWWGRRPQEVTGREWYWPLTGWREVYGETIYYGRDRSNVIGTLDYKEGLALGHIGPVGYDAYLTLEAGADRNLDYWNNYVQAGPGFRIAPFKELDLKLSLEYFWGRYYRGDTAEVAPRFSDFVVTLGLYHEF